MNRNDLLEITSSGRSLDDALDSWLLEDFRDLAPHWIGGVDHESNIYTQWQSFDPCL